MITGKTISFSEDIPNDNWQPLLDEHQTTAGEVLKEKEEKGTQRSFLI